MQTIRTVVLSLALVLFTCFTQASIIFQTQELPTSPINNGGLAVSSDFWAFQNFELQTDTRIATLGAYFDSTAQAASVFAAIVALDDINDTPNSINLSTSDLLHTRLISIDSSVIGDFSVDVDFVLSAGFYALGFGQGAFGADNTDSISLANILPDIPAGNVAPYTARQAGNAFNAPAEIIYQAATPRVFIEEFTVVSVPSMSAVILLLFSIGLVRRSKM